MRIFRCGIVDYPEGQIYSLDLHPSGKYIATCGNNGKGDGLVTIWKTSCFSGDESNRRAIFDVSDAGESIPMSRSSLASVPPISSDEASKYKLAEKRLFNNSQNCVRWSRNDNGRWLVAAGDSSILYLYEPLKNNGFSLENVNNLMGHSMEITHADFSKDGKFLASCSLDNSIVIWNMEDLPKIVIVLNSTRGGHNDFVTGLSWDPVEKFLATQSADNTMKIWRCETWQCERTIKGSFSKGSASSLYTRLDWSADGAFLIAACSTNNGFQTAKIIIRKGFDFQRDLVGFKRIVSCVRSSDRCVLYQDPDLGKVKVSLIAVGSLDRSVSVWMLPGLNRPLFVIRNFFPEGVIDLTWYRSTLAVIGVNGSVRCISFDEEDIGKYLSGAEMCSHFDGLYGNIPSAFKTFLPKLKVDGSSSWVEQILQDVHIPSGEISSQCIDSHRKLGIHVLSPVCAQCCKLYLRSRDEFNDITMDDLAKELHKECYTILKQRGPAEDRLSSSSLNYF